MKWQNDPAFCSWLLSSQYAKESKGKIEPYLSGGVVLYMWEAFQHGLSLRGSNGKEEKKKEHGQRGGQLYQAHDAP